MRFVHLNALCALCSISLLPPFSTFYIIASISILKPPGHLSVANLQTLNFNHSDKYSLPRCCHPPIAKLLSYYSYNGRRLPKVTTRRHSLPIIQSTLVPTFLIRGRTLLPFKYNVFAT